MTAADGPERPHAGRRPRPRRERTVRELLGSIVLGFELVIVFLGSLVLYGLHALPAGLALGGGAALIVLMLVAVGLLRSPAGIALGWLAQLAVVAAGFLVPAFFIVGAIFTAIWTYCMIAGARIDRAKVAAHAAQHTETENP